MIKQLAISTYPKMKSIAVLLAAFFIFLGLQGTNGETKRRIETEDSAPGFNNAKERAEFFEKIKETHTPLEETGLPIVPGRDTSEVEDFIEDTNTQEDAAELDNTAAISYVNKNEDDLNSLDIAEDRVKADAHPGWPCRRRRWWGSCSIRRRTIRFARLIRRRRLSTRRRTIVYTHRRRRRRIL